MRFSKYPKDSILEVSIDDPKEFSVDDITRYIQLNEQFYLNNEEKAEMLRIKRAMANSIKCTDCNIEVAGSTLYITAL